MNGKAVKLCILVSHPIQYFTPVYRELAVRSDVDLTVLFRTRVGMDSYHDSEFGQTVKWDIPLLDDYRHIFLSSKTRLSGFEPSIFWRLYQFRPDVMLVHGYNHPTNLAAIAWAKLLDVKVLMRGDTPLSRHHERAGLLKRLFKRTLFRLIDGFLSIGSLNRTYYLAHGVRDEQIFFAPFCVDNTAFSTDEKDRLDKQSSVRYRYGIALDACVILFAAKFIERKRAMDILDAFKPVSQDEKKAILLFAGSGPEEAKIRYAAQYLPEEKVIFIGFKNQSELPAIYAASDIFVLPSADEPWGLAVNEAMAAGLPVVITNEVGAAPDLVEGKDTGFIYPCGDVKALASILTQLIESPDLRHRMGANARRVISGWDVKACAEGHVIAAKKLGGLYQCAE